MDDKAARIFNLNPGDQVTATIVSAGPPEILTAQQVDAELAATSGDASTTAAATPAADQPAATSAATTADTAAAPAPASEEGAKKPWLWLLALIFLAFIIWLIVRSRPKKIPIRM